MKFLPSKRFKPSSVANQIKPWWSWIIPKTLELDRPSNVVSWLNFNKLSFDSITVFFVLTEILVRLLAAWSEKLDKKRKLTNSFLLKVHAVLSIKIFANKTTGNLKRNFKKYESTTQPSLILNKEKKKIIIVINDAFKLVYRTKKYATDH